MLTSKDKRIVDLLKKEKLDKADCILKSCGGNKNGKSMDRASGRFEELCYIYDHIMGILSDDDEGESDGKYRCTGNNCIDGISEYLKKTRGKTEDGEVIVYPGIMKECVGEPAMLEQLAEECTELAKAALKLARIERGENPTPVNKEDAIENLIEEYSDVENCARELNMKPCRDIMDKKLERFVERWSTSHKKQI